MNRLRCAPAAFSCVNLESLASGVMRRSEALENSEAGSCEAELIRTDVLE